MNLANQLTRLLGDSLGSEIDPVFEDRSGSAERTVVPATVNEILGGQRVAVFLFKFFHCRDRNRGGVAEPIDVAFTASGIKGQSEVIEEGRETNHIHLGVGLKPDRQGILDMLPGARECHIEGTFFDAPFLKRPVIRQIVVHLGRIPNLHCEEAHGVDVERLGGMNRNNGASGVLGQIPDDRDRIDDRLGRNIFNAPL